MTRVLSRAAMAASFLLLAGCGSTEPTNVDLTGTWGATVDALGIGPMTLILADRNNDLRATGQWTPREGGTPLTVSGQGLHFGVDINLVLVFSTASGASNYTTQGRVEDQNSFHLVFPTADTPTRVVFRRQ